MESKLCKKLFSMCIVIAMVLSMCPTMVFAEGTSTTDFSDYTYVAFGDSIVYGADGDTGERVAKPYVTAAGEILGIGTVLNLAKSGSTWTECPPRVNMGQKAIKYNGKADIIEASCPDHVCVDQRAISKTGEAITCLPNKTVITIDGEEEAEIDFVS